MGGMASAPSELPYAAQLVEPVADILASSTYSHSSKWSVAHILVSMASHSYHGPSLLTMAVLTTWRYVPR